MNLNKNMGKTSAYYHSHPEARKKKIAYDVEYNKTPKRRRYRANLNKFNRKMGTYGNGDGKDASHKNGKIVGMEPQSINRARKRKRI